MIAAPVTRSYVGLYRAPQTCPDCGGAHWLVGRQSAECALCGTALALAPRDPATDPQDIMEGRI